MKEQDSTYCIYRHISPSGKVYIGQTCRDVTKRWINGFGYKTQSVFYRAIQKYGWNNITHEILLEGISKSEADYAEKYLIRWYKIHHLSYNITDGGDGTCGVTAWNKGMSWSEEVKAKMSQSKKGHKYGPQSALHIKHKVAVHKIPIVMVSIDDPNLWKPFASAKDAELYDKSFDRKGICRSLKNQAVHAYGYFWFYKDQFTIGNYLDKLEAWKKARIHYKKEICPDWINLEGDNIITCLKLKEQ